MSLDQFSPMTERALGDKDWTTSANPGTLPAAVWSLAVNLSGNPEGVLTDPQLQRRNQPGLVQVIGNLVARCMELLALPKDWDTYGAKQIRSDVVQYALTIVFPLVFEGFPVPKIVPVPNGGIQLEWHTRKGELELEIERPYGVAGYLECAGLSSIPSNDEVQSEWIRHALSKIA